MRSASILLIILTLLTPAWAQTSEPPLQRVRNIQLPAVESTELVSVALDVQVYAATADDMRDVRILDGNEREVAYVLRRRLEQTEQDELRIWRAKDIELDPSEEQGLTISFALDEGDPAPQELRLVTPLADFEQSVTLFGIVDGQEQQLAQDVIFDYQRFMNVRRTHIKFPATQARQFRLVVGSLTAEQESLMVDISRDLEAGNEQRRIERSQLARRPFRIEAIELSGRDKVLAPVLQVYPVDMEPLQDSPMTPQASLLNLTNPRVPLISLTLQTTSQNFSRRVMLRTGTEAGTGGWADLTGEELHSFNFRNLQEQDLTLTFPPTRSEKFHLLIYNGDSAPLTITGVEARGVVDELYFLAEPNSSYRLVYGDHQLQQAHYDTALLETALEKKQTAMTATLAEQESTLVATPAPLNWADLLENPLIVGPVILLLIGLLGWSLYRAAQQIKPETGEGN